MRKISVLLCSILALAAAFPAFGQSQKATLTAVQDAPCRAWNTNNGSCQSWDTYIQSFPDYNSLISVFQDFGQLIASFDARVGGLERKLNPNGPSNPTTLPQWSIAAVEAAPCRLWRGQTGTCETWDKYAQHFPDFTTAAAVFQLHGGAINALADRVSALELIVNPNGQHQSGHVADVALVAVETTPCTLWNAQNGRCARAYTHVQHYPGYASVVDAFNAGASAVKALDARIATLENQGVAP